MGQAAQALQGPAQSPQRGLNARISPKMLSSGTSCLVGAELAGCCSHQSKQNPGERIDTQVHTPVDPLAVVSATACHFCTHSRTQDLPPGSTGLGTGLTTSLPHQARSPEALLCVPLP